MANVSFILNLLMHPIIFGLAATLVGLFFTTPVQLFTFHPTLMTLGVRRMQLSTTMPKHSSTTSLFPPSINQLFVVMTEAIFSINTANAPTQRLTVSRRKQLHWLLQAIAVSAITAGFTIIVVNKGLHDRPHFTSVHGIFGLCTVIAVAISLLGGIVAWYAVQWRAVLFVRPSVARLAHQLLGTTAYGLGMTTLALGLFSTWFAGIVGPEWRIVFTVVVAVVAVYTVFVPLRNVWDRLSQLVGNRG